MILKRFFESKPKWQHPDPEIRRQAVSSISDREQATLAQIAREDSDAGIRRLACGRLFQMDLLQDVAAQDSDPETRDLAASRLRQVICGDNPLGPPLETRIALLGQTDDPRLLEQAATQAAQPELRRAAITRIRTPSILLDIALNDATAGNRLEAARLLEDREALEQLLRSVKKRDKNVYRAARQKLRDLAERDAAPARARAEGAELCGKVERLGRLHNWSQDRSHLEQLDKLWATLVDDAPPDLRERYEGARQRFLDAYDAYRRENQTQIEAAEAAERSLLERRRLIDDLKFAASAEEAEESDLIAVGDRVAAEWQSLPLASTSDERRLEAALSAAREALASRVRSLRELKERAGRLAALLDEAEQLVQGSSPLDHRAVNRLLHNLAEHAATIEVPDLRQRLLDSRRQLELRLEAQRHHAEQKLAQLPERLAELEAHLAAGELRKAEPILQSTESTLALLRLSGASQRRFAEVERRLHATAPRVRELQHWRKWGTDQHREQLCDTLTKVLESDMDMAQTAHALHEAQVAWKRLDHGGSPLNHRLWDRFHELAEQVYNRCRPFLEQQAAEREKNRIHREALCAELERFVAEVDWTRIEWRKAVRAEQETRAAWAAAGPVEGRHRKVLERRFRNAIGKLDRALSEERSRNLELKRRLIEQVEALADEEDLQRAIDSTKNLQREWHTTVPARQGEENRLWQRFRKACDAIFARREAAHAEQTRSESENLEARRTICEALKQTAHEQVDVEALEGHLADLQERWDAMSHLRVPRASLAALERSWREAQGECRRAVRRLRDEGERQQLDLLRDRAAICRALETLAVRDPPTSEEIDRLERAWSELPILQQPALQEAISARFNSVREALAAGGRRLESWIAALGENDAERERLCLQMEILAGIDSPRERAANRLAFQVSRLAEHMREGADDPLLGGARLERDWYLTGPASPTEADGLEERFERARTALLDPTPSERLQ